MAAPFPAHFRPEVADNTPGACPFSQDHEHRRYLHSSPAKSTAAGKYLTIGLDTEAYGIPVLRVREIIRLPKITPVPQVPDYVKGVINLRGRVIPVIDLRVKFGFAAEFAERTCIVVVQVKLPSSLLVLMGMVVDRVDEVVMLTADEIEPTPDFGAKVNTDCLLGMAKVKGQVKTLLDIDRIIAIDAVTAVVKAV